MSPAKTKKTKIPVITGPVSDPPTEVLSANPVITRNDALTDIHLKMLEIIYEESQELQEGDETAGENNEEMMLRVKDAIYYCRARNEDIGRDPLPRTVE
jgi:hypothetical protein